MIEVSSFFNFLSLLSEFDFVGYKFLITDMKKM